MPGCWSTRTKILSMSPSLKHVNGETRAEPGPPDQFPVGIKLSIQMSDIELGLLGGWMMRFTLKEMAQTIVMTTTITILMIESLLTTRWRQLSHLRLTPTVGKIMIKYDLFFGFYSVNMRPVRFIVIIDKHRC